MTQAEHPARSGLTQPCDPLVKSEKHNTSFHASTAASIDRALLQDSGRAPQKAALNRCIKREKTPAEARGMKENSAETHVRPLLLQNVHCISPLIFKGPLCSWKHKNFATIIQKAWPKPHQN